MKDNINISIDSALEDNFIRYAGHVNKKRAVVDARDGLKFSARQILYAQQVSGITADKKAVKATKSVAAAMADFYVHGDASCYGSLIKMARPFSLRYPLQEAIGNYGTMTNSNSEAAARYVELKPSKIAQGMFNGLKKGAIINKNWSPNYDNTTKFPTVLPTLGYYNIVNGFFGIGVGMAASCPTFNINDVNNALRKLLFDENASFEDIYCPIDFPTGGIVINENEVKESLQRGFGKVAQIRAKMDYSPTSHAIIVKEIPFGVFTDTITDKIRAHMNENEKSPFVSVIDGSADEAYIEIYLHKDVIPEDAIEILYQETPLQSTFGINLMMYDAEKNKTHHFGWKEALLMHIKHVINVQKRLFENEKKALEHRIHILNGLLIAIGIIHEIVHILENSNSPAVAKEQLTKTYLLDDAQAEEILKMRLARLTSLEVEKLEQEKLNLAARLEQVIAILASDLLLKQEVEKHYIEVQKQFGDARRTVNCNIVKTDDEDRIVEMLDRQRVIYWYTPENFYKKKTAGANTIPMHEKDTMLIVGQDGKGLFVNAQTLFDHPATYKNFVKEHGFVNFIALDPVIDKHLIIVTKNNTIKKIKISPLLREKGRQTILLASPISSTEIEKEFIFAVSSDGYCLAVPTETLTVTSYRADGATLFKGDCKISFSSNFYKMEKVCYNNITVEIEERIIRKRGQRGVRFK